MELGIADILGERAAAQAGVEAFRFLSPGGGAETITYDQLHARARALAEVLRARGAAGERVLLLFPSSLEFIVALFGCFLAGAVAVPVPALTAQRAFDRVSTIASDARPAFGLTLSSLEDQLKQADADTRALPWIAIDRFAGDKCDARSPRPAPDGLALIQYTSGTTSLPRGVMLTHANLVHNLAAMLSGGVKRDDDKAVSWLPMHHDLGLMLFVLFPVFSAMPCVLLSPLSFLTRPLRWLETISAHRGTVSAAPCFAYDLCVRRSTPEQRARLDLSSWRFAICGAERVRAEVMESFANAFAPAAFAREALTPAFGLAENTLCVAFRRGVATVEASTAGLAQGRLAVAREEASDCRHVACGWPLGGQSVAIVDPESGERRRDGEIGEIWVRGGSVGRGYWRDAEATARTFRGALSGEIDGEWLRTGDLGALAAEGLVVTGRIKDILIVRGANLNPLDLEAAAVESSPALGGGACAAFAVETENGEAVVLACEVPRAALGALDLGALVGAVAGALAARFGVGLHDLALLRAGSLPRTTSGKIQRYMSRELYLQNALLRLNEDPHPALQRFRPRP